jgi:hypothetical protein
MSTIGDMVSKGSNNHGTTNDAFAGSGSCRQRSSQRRLAGADLAYVSNPFRRFRRGCRDFLTGYQLVGRLKSLMLNSNKLSQIPEFAHHAGMGRWTLRDIPP